MNFKVSLCAVAAAAVMAVTLPVSAASLPNLSIMKDGAMAQSQIDQVHFAHRKCRKGTNGAHKHVKGVGRIQCTTAKCYTNIFGYRSCDFF